MGLLTERIKRQRMLMAAPYLQGDVLDIGCGAAEALDYAGPAMTSYTGIDVPEGHVARLGRDFPRHDFVCRNLDEDRFDLPRRYDVALLLAVIEHIYNQKHLMKEILGALKPGGRIVITTPTPFGNDVVHRWGAPLGLFCQSAFDDHIVIYNRKRFAILARDFSLELERYQHFQFGCNQLAVLRTTETEHPPL